MTVSGNLLGIENPIDSPINHVKQSNGIHKKLSAKSKPLLNGYANGHANGHSLVSRAIRSHLIDLNSLPINQLIKDERFTKKAGKAEIRVGPFQGIVREYAIPDRLHHLFGILFADDPWPNQSAAVHAQSGQGAIPRGEWGKPVLCVCVISSGNVVKKKKKRMKYVRIQIRVLGSAYKFEFVCIFL